MSKSLAGSRPRANGGGAHQVLSKESFSVLASLDIFEPFAADGQYLPAA